MSKRNRKLDQGSLVEMKKTIEGIQGMLHAHEKRIVSLIKSVNTLGRNLVTLEKKHNATCDRVSDVEKEIDNMCATPVGLENEDPQEDQPIETFESRAMKTALEE